MRFWIGFILTSLAVATVGVGSAMTLVWFFFGD